MQFIPRKLLFKAWNTETKLMMRLNSIECVKGELFSKDHILLQFTGLYDQREEEIYEMDVVMIAGEKFIVSWDAHQNGWGLAAFSNPEKTTPFLSETSNAAIRLWNYFESEKIA
ncbi:MAG: YopX family protein [Cyclobacteriaceae bacterium]